MRTYAYLVPIITHTFKRGMAGIIPVLSIKCKSIYKKKYQASNFIFSTLFPSVYFDANLIYVEGTTYNHGRP